MEVTLLEVGWIASPAGIGRRDDPLDRQLRFPVPAYLIETAAERTPGHTPGHQSVRIGERLVIGGDVAHFAAGLDDLRFPVFADVRPGHDPAVLTPGPVPL